MDNLLYRLGELLRIKNIITLATVGVFVFLSIKGSLTPTESMVVISMVFTYFFSRQDSSKKGDKQ